jgi:hypothetical protein
MSSRSGCWDLTASPGRRQLPRKAKRFYPMPSPTSEAMSARRSDEAAFPKAVNTPDGSPNVPLDDVGFGQFSVAAAECRLPT